MTRISPSLQKFNFGSSALDDLKDMFSQKNKELQNKVYLNKPKYNRRKIETIRLKDMQVLVIKKIVISQLKKLMLFLKKIFFTELLVPQAQANQL